MTPSMFVVGGPSGSGKSTLMPIRVFGVDYFSVDDRCASIHGGYVGIPRHIRDFIGAECEAFVRHHLERHISFALETTMRTTIAIEQARAARQSGFSTSLLYFCTDDPDIHIERVLVRSQNGGHSAPPDEIKATYAASLLNLVAALRTFEVIDCYDTTAHNSPARHIATIRDEVATIHVQSIPNWIHPALESL